ncbi:MAG: M48 family metallopeptidase [Lachnoclostridium sp.]|nr:M48 family metallopeptidase [Lachnoclostridium sp.]
MAGVSYKINPRFRLTTTYLSVRWHQIDKEVIESEAAFPIEGRYILRSKAGVELMVHFHAGVMDVIYHHSTDFEAVKTQKWLRSLFRDIIMRVASEVLPQRVKYWENLKGLHGNGVSVKRLRKNILGQCSMDNHITLPPYLVIFRQDWMDGVILHEMAHYRHKHHRQPFWDFLSTLLGQDSRLAKVKDEIALSPYYDYYLYLTR